MGSSDWGGFVSWLRENKRKILSITCHNLNHFMVVLYVNLWKYSKKKKGRDEVLTSYYLA